MVCEEGRRTKTRLAANKGGVSAQHVPTIQDGIDPRYKIHQAYSYGKRLLEVRLAASAPSPLSYASPRLNMQHE